MSLLPPIITADRECLASFARTHNANALRPVVERYFAFVYSAAFRRTNDPARAAEVTRAVFLVLARRARRLRKKTVLAGWLFHVTAVACRRAGVKSRRSWLGFLRNPRAVFLPDAPLWTRISGEVDGALERLSSKQRNAVLLLSMLNWPAGSAAAILRTSEARARKHRAIGLKKMARRLNRRASSRVLGSFSPGASSSLRIPRVTCVTICSRIGTSPEWTNQNLIDGNRIWG